MGTPSDQPYSSTCLRRFEGLDGTGKTTTAKATAELLGATYITTPSAVVRAYRDEIIASFAGCQKAAQLLYLATVFAASQDARRLLREGRLVVVDRYFLSAQAYAAFRGTQLELDAVEHLLLPADLTVFLDVPIDVRRARLAARGQSDADRETLPAAADTRIRAEHMARCGLGVVGRFVRIDTGQDALPRVVDRVLEALRATAQSEVRSDFQLSSTAA